MKLNDFSRVAVEELVGRLKDGMRDELSSLKKSLSIDEAGPLGIKETARYLKMSTQSIYKEVEKGSIPHYQDSPGSKIFFYKEELDTWVRSKKRISKKEILNEADNLKIGSYGNK